jgi:hypothetical protein
MSSHKDNTHNKQLKDFLDKKNQENQSMDDFEKEAMEGFDMLKDEKEIADLKNALDQKIYSEVFSEKKKSPAVYWYAAAGLLLVIGFSVYFVLGTGAVKENKIAIHKEEAPKDKGDEIQKIITAESAKNKSLEYKQPESPMKATTPVVESGEGKAGKKEKEYDLQEESISARNDALATQGTGAGGVAVSATKPQPQAIPLPEPATEEGDALKQAKAEEQGNKDEHKKAVVAETMLAMESKDDRTAEKAASKKPYRARAEESPVTTYNAPAATGAAAMDIAGFLCYYEGGDATLHRDVKDKLKDNDLLQKFDATLYINERKKVEKAEITNAYGLNKEQQEKIIEVLKKLDKFKFNIKPQSGELTEYKLVFRP